MNSGTLVSVGLYFIIMLGVGLHASRRSGADAAAFLLGGRQLGPAVTALSAGASDMSAWILMGLPGAMFASGFGSAWIAIGLVAGAWLNYLLVAPRLRVYTELAGDALTLPDFFEKRFGGSGHALRVLASLVIVLFFTLYTSAGMVAGGVLFESSFGLGYATGVGVTAGVVVAYSLLGGFRAVCLTDFVQGTLMLLALLAVPLIAWAALGEGTSLAAAVARGSPSHLDFLGLSGTAIASNLAWGLGYFGQPHIIVRFMAIRSVGEIAAARRIGMSWMILALAGALATGFVGFALALQDRLAVEDPETVFIVLSQTLFHPLAGGFLLAAILAAIMSTISSQLLVSASSLSEDFYKVFLRREAGGRELVLVSRIAILLVTGLAILLALDRDTTILALVSNAWAGFGAAFGPLVLLSLFWPGMNRAGALAGILCGAFTVLAWIYAPLTIDGQRPSEVVYEIVPGFLLSALAIVIASRLTGGAGAATRQGFAAMERRLAAIPAGRS